MNNDDLVSSDILQVFLTFEKRINKLLKVASLGKITSFNDNDKSVNVQLFPKFKNETNKMITCYYLNDKEGLEVGQIVCVLFLDRNFIKNLKKMQEGRSEVLVCDDSELHSDKFGIILKVY